MDPVSLTALTAVGMAGSTAMALGSKPPLPNIPQPPKPQQTPAPKPRPKSSMQDSFLTGVAGVGGQPNAGTGGKTLLGQ